MDGWFSVRVRSFLYIHGRSVGGFGSFVRSFLGLGGFLKGGCCGWDGVYMRDEKV